MARKINPVARLLSIYETLTEEQAAIAFDLLRSKQPKRAVGKRKPRQASPARSVGERSAPKFQQGSYAASTEIDTDNVLTVTTQGEQR